jgi:hypothetical protein
MQTQKTNRPAFQSVELEDPMDQRLEAKAAEKGIPTLVTPEAAAPAVVAGKRSRAGGAAQSTPRARMKKLGVEEPDYAWIAVKTRAAREMVSVRHVIMSALRAQGIEIKDADMSEEGRRLPGAAG